MSSESNSKRVAYLGPEDLLIPGKQKQKPTNSFNVVAEQFVSIHHCVLSHAEDISKVEKLLTHPQAWGQVTNWTLNEGKHLDKIDTSSTSKAAEIASKEGETHAAIASEYASKVHNIPILYKNVENNKENTTRFLILSKEKAEDLDRKYISLVAFTVEHDDAGALASALNVLSKHGINLTSITSRPSLNQLWQYVFFIEFWSDGRDDPNVKSALEELKEKTVTSVTIGTFPRNKRYYGEKTE
ncbi:hypothetical protein BN7_4028 [Wickerhamomyces ciferrii]|uniref:Prephenate dehydratase n=1 Tax=Wickerhamomyces ciferrii (strain ATCC 14091 / BCRC 22168 / CBS 111 / JCM 3599 / NBRC 0793 / NRRL Y-1031 F-60-10) TaxID=1206466 RepID=K0KSV8_WICCF|nr:uncharacterized protein BN7_4028 [Wickerhamomyces ciferrii]CCH44464.1 hypothetical protein BN7_4028 [Wickerhamomyces ciferrii]